MIKFKQGWIGNNEGVKKDIVVKAKAPNSLKEIIIGGSMILMGITYLTKNAFKNGSEAFEKAEFKTLGELGLLDDDLKD